MTRIKLLLCADPDAFGNVEQPAIDPVDTIVNDRAPRPLATVGDKWPEIRSPQPVTEPIRHLSPEILAECAAAKARILNSQRAGEREDELYTEGRIHRPNERNPHD